MYAGNEITRMQNVRTNTPRGCRYHVTDDNHAYQPASAYNSLNRHPTNLVLEQPSSIMVHAQEQFGDGRHGLVVVIGPLGLVRVRDIVPVPASTTTNGFVHVSPESVLRQPDTERTHQPMHIILNFIFAPLGNEGTKNPAGPIPSSRTTSGLRVSRACSRLCG